MPTVYLIATPIGNLEDITLRALRTLQEVDVVFCEDTRVTAKLLFAHDIRKPLRSLHEHSGGQAFAEATRLLKSGKSIAYVSDAGTPGISDPGGKLVEHLAQSLAGSVIITPVPGPSALAAAASVAGMPLNRFVFLGYPPHKKGRRKYFEEILASPYPVIFYESTHRIVRSLRELREAGIRDKTRYMRLVVCRELTKKFETIYRGTIDEVLPVIEKNAKGEFAVIVEKRGVHGS